jgi:hypothetical protein
MSRTSLILNVLVYGMALAQSLPAIAGGVSDADLRGKKICWNNGASSSYSKDGSFDGTFAGHGTWSLVGDQIEVNGDHASGVNTITKDGDTFHVVRRASRSGKDIEAWGKYCN